MTNAINQFFEKLSSYPEIITFEEVISLIDKYFIFNPTGFDNGGQRNEAGQNSGSCKIFSFAQNYDLNPAQTLILFGQYYRGVLATPEGNDHQNIRQFMQYGFAGITFDGQALIKKKGGQ